jgi:pimeloyl-ACP methyl ester carboxylesterase
VDRGDRDATLLLIPGAWHGAWLWEKVEPLLTARGWQVQAMDLPSSAADPGPRLADFYDDADAVRDRITSIGGPVVVVAHSYGGAVATQGAADLPNVKHLVYVCGFQLDVGESLLGLVGAEPDWWVVEGETMTTNDPRAVFYGDVPESDAERAIARMTPLSYVTVTQPLTAAAWHTVPCTYIVCERDAAIPEGQEMFAQRATFVRRLPSSHSPMLSMPEPLAQLIDEAGNTLGQTLGDRQVPA